jgi:hypothetical protein
LSRRGAPASGAVSLVWLAALAGHAAVALAMRSLLPRGFPLLHPRFFVNELVPALLLAAALAGLVLLLVRPALAALSLAALPALWWSVAVALPLVFPVTGTAPLGPVLAVALVLSIAYVPLWSRIGQNRAWIALPLLAGALTGAFSVRCLRAPDPTTRPRSQKLPASALESTAALAPGLVVDAGVVRIGSNHSSLRAWIDPSLGFTSRSPDRFWTIFTPAGALLAHAESRVSARPTGPHAATIESFTLLHDSVYSHLNSFLELELTGHTRLALRFSPCPGALIDVLHADYPAGAPARFAYADAAGAFHVVEATDAEKGPYRTLARGSLPRGTPVVLTFLETAPGTERELLDVTLHDWSAQLSTALSPTAGYGVAENAIEFRLSAPERSASAHVFVTLAGTGVGRGWDSVGHAAGAYRNRITLDWKRELTPP